MPILRHGPRPNSPITEGAILDVLESYGFISTLENRILEDRRELEGEKLTIYWGDAGFDFPSVNLIIEDALDKDVDVLVTLGGTVTASRLTDYQPDGHANAGAVLVYALPRRRIH